MLIPSFEYCDSCVYLKSVIKYSKKSGVPKGVVAYCSHPRVNFIEGTLLYCPVNLMTTVTSRGAISGARNLLLHRELSLQEARALLLEFVPS